MTFAEQVPLNDAQSLMDASSVVGRRIKEWVRDPEATMADIRTNPGFVDARDLSPTDPYDYRLP